MFFETILFGESALEKPSALPKNWPRPTEADLQEKPKRIVNIGQEQEYRFCNNFVKTSKYEIWNFIPKFLLEEFNPKTKVANCYFLLISALQCIPFISNTGGYPTTLIPLLFVVAVDALFQIVEDIARHRADKEANSSVATRFDHLTNDLVKCHWHELAVGDIVKIHSRELIPADIVVLATAEKGSHPQGICYVETKSLDGETNLKMRNAMPNTLSKLNDTYKFNSLQGKIEMEHPNKVIVSFTGILDIEGMGREVIQLNNTLLRGCVLRNTDWIVGIVVNTGHDTKIMMSNTETKPKSSFLETQASIEIQRIIILLAIVCFTGATGSAIWNSVHHVKDIWYLHWNPNPVGYWFVKFFYYFLLHATFIPVSLYVSMSVIRFFQSYFMNQDLEMYYERLDAPSLVRTMTLNEELGQISHIFSDKTGTLTCNVMDFRKMSIHGVTYGVGITEIGKAAAKLHGREIPDYVLEGEKLAKENSVPHVSFYCPKFVRDVQTVSPQQARIQNFFRYLSVCHDVIPERIDNAIRLSASNPDDEALVCAAAYFGFEFVDRRENVVMIKNKELDVVEEMVVLEVIPFSSKRKRMSVIVREPSGTIRLICKGADTVMWERLAPNQEDLVEVTNKDLVEFSEEGLRCLIVGCCIISEERYSKWSTEYKMASTNMAEIEKKKSGEKNAIEYLENVIEADFQLLGVTAIEDRLQDGVPECISKLTETGISIWVLTGDKEETAINIAVACNLVLPPSHMKHIILNKKTAPTKKDLQEMINKEIQDYNAEYRNKGSDTLPRAVIVDGPSLITIMADVEQRGCRELLLELSLVCKVVVGCRVSPDQKREMVHLVKTGIEGVRTLAIGDGANDVAMIQEAHIGVGIRGEEGLQAVNSSDYAIAQFAYLSPLLLKHGRYNYIRMSGLVSYMFYKNIYMSMGQFWFNFNNAFSGQKYYTEGAIQMFNLLYTSLPILLFGIYDMDITPKQVYNNPSIYKGGIDNEYFKPGAFWRMIGWAFAESVLSSVLPMYTLDNAEVKSGTQDSFWMPGAACYTIVVIVCSMKILFLQSRFHWIHAVVLLASIALWFASAFFINDILFFDYNWYSIWNVLVEEPAFWLTLLIVVTSIGLKDLYIIVMDRSMNMRPVDILREMDSTQPRGNISSVGIAKQSSEPFRNSNINSGLELNDLRNAEAPSR